MINKTLIDTELAQLVGYRNENEHTLDVALNVAISGLFVNDLTGISLQAIESAGFLKSDLTPESTVSEYLEKIYNAELNGVLNEFLFKSQTLLRNKAIKSQGFENKFRNTEVSEQDNGRFVGFLMSLANGYNLISTIKRISLQLLEVQNIKIYLYDLLKQEAINIFDFDFTTAKDVQSKLTDFLLEYQDENSRSKDFLLGYYEFDSSNPLPEHQLNESNKSYQCKELTEGACSETFMSKSITIPNDYLNFNAVSGNYDLPIEAIENCDDNDYINFDFYKTTECDYTDIIIENKLEFAQVLQYQLAKRIISDCLFSNEFNTITESNRSNWNNLILHFNNLLNGYEFTDEFGNSGRKKGMIKELVESFEGIDINCFPKRRKIRL